MPLYEYRCTKCGLEFERIVFSTDKQRVTCPQCGASQTKRLLSVFSSGEASGRGPGTLTSSCGSSSGGFS
ncbi:MAG: zinc ribbon domain-containing protein [Deltaproteobacteria bacterium]|nr:zinc ribbon domain-containing protein [Deltaproteobacteria bacterium]